MFAALPTAARPTSPLGVRLVLGCGGIKPIAAVPVLMFLDRLGVEVDEIVGCSGGAVVGSLYATGASGAEIQQTISRLLRPQLFSAIDAGAALGALGSLLGRRSRRGLLRPDGIHATFREVFGDRLVEALPRRLVLQATDFVTHRPVTVRHGPLAAALYASMAAYPLLPPIKLGKRWLIDGAFCAPLPLHAASQPARLTIAISVNRTPAADFTDRLLGLPDEPACTAVPFAANDGAANDDTAARLLVIRLPITCSVRWWDTHLLPELFAAGERAVAQHAGAIAAALDGQPRSVAQSTGGAIQLCRAMPPSTTTVVPVT